MDTTFVGLKLQSYNLKDVDIRDALSAAVCINMGRVSFVLAWT